MSAAGLEFGKHFSGGLRPDAGDRRTVAVFESAGMARIFERVLQLSDGQIRFFGLGSISAAS